MQAYDSTPKKSSNIQAYLKHNCIFISLKYAVKIWYKESLKKVKEIPLQT